MHQMGRVSSRMALDLVGSSAARDYELSVIHNSGR